MPLQISDNIPVVQVGEKTPDFALINENGDEWRLSDCLGKVVLLLFYPSTDCSTASLCSVRDNWTKYSNLNPVIVGVLTYSPEVNKSLSNKHSLPIPLLSDADGAVTHQFGRHSIFPRSWTRAVVIIDGRGVVRTRDVKLRVFRQNDDEIVKAIFSAKTDPFYQRYDELKTRIHDTLGT